MDCILFRIFLYKLLQYVPDLPLFCICSSNFDFIVFHNFREEYINTVGRVLFYNYRLTEEDIKLLRENLNATTEEQILNAKNIKKPSPSGDGF